MGDVIDAALRLEQLQAAAATARRRAEEARRLAAEIGRRREVVVRRDDPCLARHTPEVWSSRAASASREALHREVGFSLWMAGESLDETRLALEQAARDLEVSASVYRRRADAVAADLQATRSVSSTSLRG